MDSISLTKALANALIFSALGIGLQMVAFWVFDQITPGKLWEEVVEKQNVAMAIVTGAVAVAIGSIIAASIHG